MNRQQYAFDLRSASRHGYQDGLADRHSARVHGIANKPHWYGVPDAWRAYLEGWRQGQRAKQERRAA
jgi:hypothetical protein